MTGDEARDVEATAHHEAGHAIAAWAHGQRIMRVSVASGDESKGHVMHSVPVLPKNWNWIRERWRFEVRIRIALAGRIAQEKFDPKFCDQLGGDAAYALEHLTLIVAPGDHARAYLRLLEIEARAIVDARWDLIRALAAELVGRRTLGGREFRAFIRAAGADPKIYFGPLGSKLGPAV